MQTKGLVFYKTLWLNSESGRLRMAGQDQTTADVKKETAFGLYRQFLINFKLHIKTSYSYNKRDL